MLALPIALLAALDSARSASASVTALPAGGVGLEQPVDGAGILAARQLAVPSALRILPQEPDVDHATRLPAGHSPRSPLRNRLSQPSASRKSSSLVPRRTVGGVPSARG